MSESIKYELEDYENVEKQYKEYDNRLIVNVTKIGLLIAALVWGLLLINIMPLLGDKNVFTHGNRDKYNPVAANGLLKVSFEAIYKNTFVPKYQHIDWIKGKEHDKKDGDLYLVHNDDVYEVCSVFDETFCKVLHKGKSFTYDRKNYTIQSFVPSYGLEYSLIRTNTIRNWRHSFFGSFFVFNLEGEVRHIGDNISLAVWSPTSEQVAYVKDNNIFIYSTITGQSIQVTVDGNEYLFNGRADWVYEEEILEEDVALWWSPKGDYLAYLKINDERVHEHPLISYVHDENSVYPEVRKLKYPKSGTPNPEATLNIYNIATANSMPVMLKEPSLLITEVKWVGDTVVLVKLMDRTADHLTLFTIDAVSVSLNAPSRIVQNRGGWFEVTRKTLYIPRNPEKDRVHDGYIDLVYSNGYNHLAYFSPPESSSPIMLTSGKWEVIDGPSAFDPEMGRVYFMATKKSSMERHLYYVTLQNPLNIFEVTDIAYEGYYSGSFSKDARFMLLTYRGPEIPYQKFVDLHSDLKDEVPEGNKIGESLYYLQDNKKFAMEMQKYSISYPNFQELNLGLDENGKEIKVNSYEYLPPDFNSYLKNHYPVFFFVYGGPNSQQVKTVFSVNFLQLIVSRLDAIVVVVDGRGTGFKGKDFRSVVRGNLGRYEVYDQIAAAKIYKAKSYVNKDKISIFGWSYGGYLTLKTLERDAGETFKYGIAVAPVTDWRYYDSVYTERYMYTPESNPEGYHQAKVENMTALALVPRILLMHGTYDDNVHFQHSLRLVDELNRAGIETYDFIVFPDSDHAINFHNADKIFFEKLLYWIKLAYSGDFIKKKL